MQKRTIFPYRRPGQKRRARNLPGGHKGRDGLRRLPGSPRELLPLLQPTTKALAQMLSGRTRASGQLAHARNVLAQAQRMIDERLVDRLGPADREEFLEQVARLKLTLADADAEAEAEVERAEEPPPPPPPPVGRERLRELALALSTPSAPAPAPEQQPAAQAEDESADDDQAMPPADWMPRGRTRPGGRRQPREAGNGDQPRAATADAGRPASGQRLRLRQPASETDEDRADDDERAAS